MTPEARNLIQEMGDLSEGVIEKAVIGFNESEVESLKLYLKKIISNLS